MKLFNKQSALSFALCMSLGLAIGFTFHRAPIIGDAGPVARSVNPQLHIVTSQATTATPVMVRDSTGTTAGSATTTAVTISGSNATLVIASSASTASTGKLFLCADPARPLKEQIHEPSGTLGTCVWKSDGYHYFTPEDVDKGRIK